jgi:hypothetical protein
VRSLTLAALLLLLPALPASAEGLVVRLEPGYALWSLDGGRIQSQAPLPDGEVQALLVGQTQNAVSLALLLGYNIRDHVTLSVSLTATGWDLQTQARGGAGLLAGELAWHPAALFPLGRPGTHRKWDAALLFGAGYGVVGEQRALDGFHLQMGVRAEYFVSPSFSLGASLRYAPLLFNRYVSNWDRNESFPLPNGSGGGLFIPALTLSLHSPLSG